MEPAVKCHEETENPRRWKILQDYWLGLSNKSLERDGARIKGTGTGARLMWPRDWTRSCFGQAIKDTSGTLRTI